MTNDNEDNLNVELEDRDQFIKRYDRTIRILNSLTTFLVNQPILIKMNGKVIISFQNLISGTKWGFRVIKHFLVMKSKETPIRFLAYCIKAIAPESQICRIYLHILGLEKLVAFNPAAAAVVAGLELVFACLQENFPDKLELLIKICNQNNIFKSIKNDSLRCIMLILGVSFKSAQLGFINRPKDPTLCVLPIEYFYDMITIENCRRPVISQALGDKMSLYAIRKLSKKNLNTLKESFVPDIVEDIKKLCSDEDILYLGNKFSQEECINFFDELFYSYKTLHLPFIYTNIKITTIKITTNKNLLYLVVFSLSVLIIFWLYKKRKKYIKRAT